MISLAFAFQLLGLATFLFLGFTLRNFIYTYFLHQSTIPKCLLPDSKSYALVTGASDGLGLALAEEIMNRGFNVIVHGRNGPKLEGVREKLQTKFPKLKVIVAEATALEPETSSKKILAIVQNIEKKEGGKLTVLINNVGGLPPMSTGKLFNEFKDVQISDLNNIIAMNATFPLVLTHSLLPTLTANQPSLVLTLGSYAGVYGSPYVMTYGATKAFDHIFSQGLSQELRMNSATKNIECLALYVAEVETAGNPGQINFAKLSRHEAARSALNRVGCGRDVTAIDWRHAITAGGMGLFPQWVASNFIAANVKAKKDAEAKGE